MRDNPQLQEAMKALSRHEAACEAALQGMAPRAGRGVRIQGQWPMWLVEPTERAEDPVDVPADWQLGVTFTGALMTFLRGRVQAGSFLVIPTIGGQPVDTPGVGLEPRSDGGQVFVRYRFTLDGAVAAPDWLDVFVDCGLVQRGLNASPPTPVMPETGNSGVSITTGEAYQLLMAYAPGGRILTYGQNSILPLDPDDDFPAEYVIYVQPQIIYGN